MRECKEKIRFMLNQEKQFKHLKISTSFFAYLRSADNVY